MINLKKLFRRKKGQGALEYLFMIAAALIIIFVVVRYISGTGSQATQQSDIAALQSQAELAKSSLQAKGWWDDTYTVTYVSENTTLKIDNIAQVDITNSAYYDDITDDVNGYKESKTLETLYDDCMAGDELSCKVLAALGGN